MKGWGRVYHSIAHQLMTELERLEPQSVVLLAAKHAFGVGEAHGGKPLGRSTSRKQDRRREALIERIAERDRLDEESAALYAKGHSLLAVANAIGKSSGWVVDSLDRQGIPRRPRNGPKPGARDGERVEQIQHWREQGKTLEEMGALLHVSRERVRQICIRHGIDTRPNEHLRPEQLAAVEEYVAGASMMDVAERHQTSTTTLRDWILRAGFLPRAKVRKHSAEVRSRAERVAALYEQGHSSRRIAEEVGLKKPEMIYRYLAIAGVRARRTADKLKEPLLQL